VRGSCKEHCVLQPRVSWCIAGDHETTNDMASLAIAAGELASEAHKVLVNVKGVPTEFPLPITVEADGKKGDVMRPNYVNGMSSIELLFSRDVKVHLKIFTYQPMYEVTQVYYQSQSPVSLWACCSSKPSVLYREENLYALRHFYGTQHVGLELETCADSQVVMGASQEGSELTQTGAQADKGHTQPGPSTGGTTLKLDDVTNHAASGQHHTTELVTTNSETYETFKAVIATWASRMLMKEVDHLQTRAAAIKDSNMVAIRKAANDAHVRGG
jgi:hypothetical protein